jgi:hypothetical protein
LLARAVPLPQTQVLVEAVERALAESAVLAGLAL